jgi:hypothetical protein
MSIMLLRQQYHQFVGSRILRIHEGIPNIADRSSKSSVAISRLIFEYLNFANQFEPIVGQVKGNQFELVTKGFLEQSFKLLQHLRPGQWVFRINSSIADYEQYKHMALLKRVLDENAALKSVLGLDYLVTPDIVVCRYPIHDDELNLIAPVVDKDLPVSQHTPLRIHNHAKIYPLLHASISCKWTLRSDRAQNVRTEALNLIRNRKGHTPHIAIVTAEPLPTRLASIALGTGDLDCVYHFALPELQRAVEATQNEDQRDILETMVQGSRLRDISDLPLDLAI